jgi:hypothetical protein
MKSKPRNCSLYLFALIFILVLPGLSFGDAPMPNLEDLTSDADLIAVAKVESIATEPSQPHNDSSASVIKGDKRVAYAEILDVWKGASGESVRFLASPTWECDVSTALVGETVLLFLTDDPQNPYKTIAYNGIGRLPVENNSVLLYNTLLTKEIKHVLEIPAETFRYSVGVNIMKQQVERVLQRRSNSPR